MKINLTKLLSVIAQVLVATPAVIAAIRPVIEASKAARPDDRSKVRSQT